MAGASVIDLAVAAAYVATLLVLGVCLGVRGKSAGDYFLASRHTGWRAIGLSLVASNVSPAALVGISGAAYASGISVYNYEWLAAVVLVAFAVWFLPTILRARVYTMPEFLERRYSPGLRLWFSGVSIVLMVLLDTAGALYAGMAILRAVAPGIGQWQALLLLAAIGGAYTIAGGLRAVIYTEAVQAVVVLGGALLLTLFAFERVGGMQVLLGSVDPERLALFRPADDTLMPWTGVLFGAPILGFYYWCTNQYMAQKMLSARSVADAQKGAILAGGLKLLTLFVIVMPGLAAGLMYEDLPTGEMAYARLLMDLLPAGVLGLVLAAFFGALLAQLSAAYNASGTLVALDFVRRFLPSSSDRQLVRYGRVGTFAALVASLLWAPQIARFPSLWQYFQTVMAYVTPPVVVLYGFGILWPKANRRGALAAVVGGSLLGLLFFAGNVGGLFDVHFLHVAAWLFAASALLMVAGSLVPAHAAAAASVPARVRERPAPLVVAVAIVVLAATAVIVFQFR